MKLGRLLRITFSIVSVALNAVGQVTAGAPWMVREGAKYGVNVGARALTDPSQALERHLVGALVERVGEGAAREIGALYRPQALKNAGLKPSGEGNGLIASKGGVDGALALEGASSTGIGCGTQSPTCSFWRDSGGVAQS
jgi:hypothetical protein